MAAGLGAKLACSGVFVSGRTLDDVTKNDIARSLPAPAIVRYALDKAGRSVSATALGLITRTAVYRPGIGCTLLVTSDRLSLARQASGIPSMEAPTRLALWPEGDEVDPTSVPSGVDRAALDRAVADAFSDETQDKSVDTRAIVAVFGGRIVAEKYARGFDKDTRLLGWSASKSVVATLVGTLVASGRLALDSSPPVPEWKDLNDPRRKITLRQLLNMSSGLKFGEPYNPGSDSTAMLFERHDMGAYAASMPLRYPPGTVWSYSSGTANLLSRLVLQMAGGSLGDYETYARKTLFDPAGMTSAVFEPDETGNFVGSSYLYATARDWARFGLLYLNRGVINGHRIVPESWVDFVRTAAPADARKGYGAHFWLNGFSFAGDKVRALPHLPPDAYFAEGHNDQFVGIFPSENAVIVRLGWTTGAASFDRDRHFAAILASLRADTQRERAMR